MSSAFTRVRRSVFVFIAALFVLPGVSFAASSVTSSTAQLLPPGGASCQQLMVTSVTPYVYDGALDSFDVVIPDSSYVAISGSVGNTVIPFRQMTRFMNPDGQLRIHTDIDSSGIHGSLPVSITLLSARQGSPVCATIVSFAVSASGTTAPGTTPAPAQPAPQPAPSKPAPSKPSVPNVPSVPTPVAPVPVPTLGSVSSFAALCAASGAYQLWFILLALYVVIAAIAALSRPPLIQKNPAIPVAMILTPLILLVGFWYFVPVCRAASWIPIVLLIIAIVGILVAFREEKGGAGVLLLPGMRPAAPKTPTTPAVIPLKEQHPVVQKIVDTFQQKSEQKKQPTEQKGSEPQQKK
ncbi:hypothetical protein K8R03_03100 [Candidatus Kaiserbacteria bacterium]|nr:hypothetical protein [Candidatus Kaiserbacteria bacterium]